MHCFCVQVARQALWEAVAGLEQAVHEVSAMGKQQLEEVTAAQKELVQAVCAIKKELQFYQQRTSTSHPEVRTGTSS